MRRASGLLAIAFMSAAAWLSLGTDRVWAAVGASPAAAGASPAETALRQIDGLLDAWRFNDAATALAALQKSAPNAPETIYLSGYQKFLTGDYAGAVKALATAAQAAPGTPEIRSLLELATAARDAVKDDREERSAHLIIRYAPEDAVLMPYARDTLEAAYAALHADLGFEAEMPIRVEFYRTPSDLAAVSSLSVAEVARTGTIALCKWARLMVTTPRALAYGYPWLDTINHELVHYAVSTLTNDRAPVWLQEGLAKFLEQRWREPPGGRIPPPMEHLLAKALRTNHLITFEAMHPSMAKLPSAEDATLAFAEVENAVAYLYDKGGMAALRDAIKRVAAGEDARQAVAAAAGGGWPEFERGWRAFMAAQHYKTFPAIDIATTHVRKANAIASGRNPAEEDALSSTLKAGAPYRYLRLGNMLLRRERPRAAVVEYEKGAKAVGTRPEHGDPSANWVFPVKLGRTYLALGEPDRALKALGSVLTLYPDLPWPNLIAGEAQLALGDAPAAITSLRASLATNPFDPQVHCALAAAYGKSPAELRPAEAVIAREQQFCKQLSAE
ncbi:MAG TPA: tetratricopeptide repeat protein [Polyangia bacterium]|nr:tetratricopeptide repeat protein [Polyangia bacterium]